MFKGEAGARLRKEIVRRSQMPAGTEEVEQQMKKRPTEEQKKIREMISSAKTLAEVEMLQQMLQSGSLHQNGRTNGVGGEENGGGGDEMEE